MFFLRKYKTIIFIAVVLISVLVMISYNLKYGSADSFLEKIVLETASPVQKVLSGSIKGVRDAWMRYLFLVGLQEENKNLKKKINELNAVIVSYQESYQEAQRLKKLQYIADNSNYRFITARVIGREQAAISRTVMINKGSADGLKNGMPVVASPGLIGRLVDVSWHVSRVLLFIDENSNVDAIVQRNRTQGIISGAGSRGMILKYVSKTQDVQVGDIVVSSGMGGVFPKGWLIGQVIHIDRQDGGLFLKIYVAPFTDFSKLEEVMILSSDGTQMK
ncbi:MAG: rod shape-determining protein MreC [Deltaproteobacteria bacterium]|nr:rod shape-determining protein MreC [Deltaproteobacteria bacterium]